MQTKFSDLNQEQPNRNGQGESAYRRVPNSDRPDFRIPDFEEMTLALPPEIFKRIMSRDDLFCEDEAHVLSLIERYISQRPSEEYE
jgi:hypothetical protein